MALDYVFVTGPKSEDALEVRCRRQAIQTWLLSLRSGNMPESIAAFSEFKQEFKNPKLLPEISLSTTANKLPQNRVARIKSRSLLVNLEQ